MATAMGVVPLTWSELVAWQSANSIQLQPWELSFIRRLSADYAAESSRATDPDRPPPWREGDRQSDAKRAAIAQGIRTSMKAAIANQSEPGKTRTKRKRKP